MLRFKTMEIVAWPLFVWSPITLCENILSTLCTAINNNSQKSNWQYIVVIS